MITSIFATFTAAEVANIIQTGAIVVSAVGVIITIIWNNRVSRKRATLDMVMAEMMDPTQIDQRREFVKLRDAGNLVQYSTPEKSNSKEASYIGDTLNTYELIAVGIKQGILCEESYKSWARTTVVKEWVACKPFVAQIRHVAKVPTYYCEFEALATKWANATEKPHC